MSGPDKCVVKTSMVTLWKCCHVFMFTRKNDVLIYYGYIICIDSYSEFNAGQMLVDPNTSEGFEQMLSCESRRPLVVRIVYSLYYRAYLPTKTHPTKSRPFHGQSCFQPMSFVARNNLSASWKLYPNDFLSNVRLSFG